MEEVRVETSLMMKKYQERLGELENQIVFLQAHSEKLQELLAQKNKEINELVELAASVNKEDVEE